MRTTNNWCYYATFAIKHYKEVNKRGYKMDTVRQIIIITIQYKTEADPLINTENIKKKKKTYWFCLLSSDSSF